MNGSRRLLYPLGSFYPAQSGGPNNSILWLARAMAGRGWSPSIVTTMQGIKSRADIETARAGQLLGIRARYFRYFGPHWASPGMMIELVRQIRRSDLVHLTSVFFPLSQLAALAARLLRRPYVLSPRGEFEAWALRYRGGRKRIAMKLIQGNLRAAVAFHATSESEAQNIRRLLPGARVYVIPNFISSEFDNLRGVPSTSRLIVRERLGVADKLVVLYMGRLHAIKGIENLVRAFARVADQGNAVLLVAGRSDDGQYEAVVRNNIEAAGCAASVKLLGHVEGEPKEDLYLAADLLVLPSHSENFGNVVIEALRHGTPVMASTGTPWQILESHGCGYWVPNAPKSLEATILSYSRLGPAERAEMRQRARHLYEVQFDEKVVTEAYVRMYCEALDGTPHA